MADAAPSARDALAGVDLFAAMSSRQLGKLAKLTRETEHQPGAEVAAEGRGALAFHVVTSGVAAVSVRGMFVRTLGPGDYFGEISLLDGGPRSATVTAAGEQPLHTLALARSTFDSLLGEEPAMAKALLKALCERLRALESAR